MFAKCLNKLFALDQRSTRLEYSIVALLVLSALCSTLFAFGDTVTDAYLHLFGGTISASR
jgi:hypothetical protein